MRGEMPRNPLSNVAFDGQVCLGDEVDRALFSDGELVAEVLPLNLASGQGRLDGDRQQLRVKCHLLEVLDHAYGHSAFGPT